jgi:hypothetical protein
MSTLLTTTLVFGCLIGAVLLGAVGRRVIPGQHFDSDSRDAVKLALGLVATMAALLLGLLISSAKSDYDTQRRQIVEMAARVATLDRLLELYGPDAASARTLFRSTLESAIRRAWPEESGVEPDLSGGGAQANTMFSTILALAPRDDSQAAIKAQAVTLITDLGERRALLLAQASSTLSTPLLVIVVCWLFVIEVGFSLLAPPKPLARASLVVSAAVASAAVLLLLELHRPFDGLIRIPSTPLQMALAGSAN